MWHAMRIIIYYLYILQAHTVCVRVCRLAAPPPANKQLCADATYGRDVNYSNQARARRPPPAHRALSSQPPVVFYDREPLSRVVCRSVYITQAHGGFYCFPFDND